MTVPSYRVPARRIGSLALMRSHAPLKPESPEALKPFALDRRRLGNAAHRLRRGARNLERAIFFQREDRDAP